MNDEAVHATRSEPFVHELSGCGPVPLAAYLKALGVLRILGDQCDKNTRLWFEGDRVHLRTALDEHALLAFFLDDYAPTPILAPWNGGSGFYENDNQDSKLTIVAGKAARLGAYREALTMTEALLVRLGLVDKPTGSDKVALLQHCRAELPDVALDWLDAAMVLIQDNDSELSAKYPPLLGTGGNDGRLDFTNNFMQRLLDVVNPDDAARPASSEGLLGNALFGRPVTGLLSKAAIGQFLPGGAGGANATAGFDADSLINPWDFVLMLEGAVLFAGSAVRALEQRGIGMGYAYPFTVRPVGAGYASSSAADVRARGEIWMPLWRRPLSVTSAKALLSEGRARVGGMRATTGLDFARAAASLGTDRGIEAFQRYGFQVRNGLSYFATPLSRVPVRRDPQVELLNDVNTWLTKTLGAVGEKAPASVSRAARRLEGAIFSLCESAASERPERTLDVLISLGGMERQLATSRKWAAASFVSPVPPLSARWLSQIPFDDVETRLAVSAASIWAPSEQRRRQTSRDSNERRALSLRESLEQVELGVFGKGSAAWRKPESPDVVWRDGPLVGALCGIVARRLLAAAPAAGRGDADGNGLDAGRVYSRVSDIAAFIDCEVDDERLGELLWGFALIEYSSRNDGEKDETQNAIGELNATLLRGASSEDDKVQTRTLDGDERVDAGPRVPPALYSLLRLVFSPVMVGRDRALDGVRIPAEPGIFRLAASGQGGRAAQRAIRRLRGSGIPASVSGCGDGQSARAAAALLFPIPAREFAFGESDEGPSLAKRVLRARRG